MLYSKNALSVVIGACKDDTRPHLNNVCFDTDGSVVATDGHVLFRAKPQTPSSRYNSKDQDYPSRPAFGKLPEQFDLKRRFTVPVDGINHILKSIPKKTMLPILGYALLSKNGSAYPNLMHTNLEADTVIRVNPEDDYPNFKQVLPQDKGMEPQFKISFRLEVLETLIKFVKAAGDRGKDQAIRFAFHGPREAAEFHFENRDAGEQMDGIIMPCHDTD